MKKITTAFFAAMAMSCSSTLDCLDGSKPEWEQKTLSEGMRFQAYSETVALYSGSDISIQQFDIEGELPNGLMSNFDGGTVRISGTPSELGNFPFKLTVKVSGDDSDGLGGCERTISKSYRIRIN